MLSPRIPKSRFLRFDQIDIKQRNVSRICSRCKRRFTVHPGRGERIEEIVLRVREKFDAHECRTNPDPSVNGLPEEQERRRGTLPLRGPNESSQMCRGGRLSRAEWR